MSVVRPDSDYRLRQVMSDVTSSDGIAESIIDLDYFTQPTPPSGSPLKVRSGGVFVSLVTSQVRVGGSFIQYTPKVRSGGVFV